VIALGLAHTISTPDQPNILVENSGQVRIADFGLAKITRNLDSIRSASCQSGFSARWAAPEVCRKGECTKAADIFSLAMVTIEVRCVPCTLQPLGLTLHTNPDIYRRGPVQQLHLSNGNGRHNTRRASATPDAPKLYRAVVGIGPALLGSRPSPAPRDFRGLTSPSHPVSLRSTLTVARPLP
jgi:serine/threonine protein kinase